MTRNATPAKGRPTLEPLDEQVDHVRGGPAAGIASGEVSGTPTLFIDGVVHRGGNDTATILLEALAG